MLEYTNIFLRFDTFRVLHFNFNQPIKWWWKAHHTPPAFPVPKVISLFSQLYIETAPALFINNRNPSVLLVPTVAFVN
jgi:hypothetical protein